MRRLNLVVAMAGVGLLSGCIACHTTSSCPAPSESFLSITDADRGSLGATMRHLPLEERLDAYHDVYVRSGHPRTMLVAAFEGSGAAGFHAALERIHDRASFNEYFWIIRHLSVVGELDVCEPRFWAPLNDKAARYNVPDRNHPIAIDFGACELIL